MATVRRFEELECWKEAREFVKLIYGLTKKDVFRKDFELVNQLRRSAVSIMANIAEGFHRNSNRDFMKFLDYSMASIAESISHCYVALDQQYINEEEMVLVNEQANSVWKQVNAFIAYLNQHNKRNQSNRSNKPNQSPQSNQSNQSNRTNKPNQFNQLNQSNKSHQSDR